LENGVITDLGTPINGVTASSGVCLSLSTLDWIKDSVIESFSSCIRLNPLALFSTKIAFGFGVTDFAPFTWMISANADRDFLGRGCENVKPSWLADLAEPRASHSVAKVFERLTCLRFSGDKCHMSGASV
jgi:hypothetical protein